MNSLSEVSDLPIYIERPDELKNRIDEIINSKESFLSYEKCRSFVQEYYSFIKTGDEYLEKLEGKIL